MTPAAGWRRQILGTPAMSGLRRELVAAGREFARIDARRAIAVERRRRAVEAAREAGVTWEEIAVALGLSTRQGAKAIITRQEMTLRHGGGARRGPA
jgi:hypothetical protein